MGKELVIRDEQTIALAERVAAAAGESVEAAVRRALQAVEEQVYAGRLERLKAFQARLAEMPRPLDGSNHGWLYDEDGLPA